MAAARGQHEGTHHFLQSAVEAGECENRVSLITGCLITGVCVPYHCSSLECVSPITVPPRVSPITVPLCSWSNQCVPFHSLEYPFTGVTFKRRHCSIRMHR
jgi:hypothetical protein